jgi:polyhydroxyalkanoate synthase subunit PhaC
MAESKATHETRTPRRPAPSRAKRSAAAKSAPAEKPGVAAEAKPPRRKAAGTKAKGTPEKARRKTAAKSAEDRVKSVERPLQPAAEAPLPADKADEKRANENTVGQITTVAEKAKDAAREHRTPESEKAGGATDTGTLAEQGHQVAQNMAEVFDVSGRIWQKWLEGQMQEGKHPGHEAMAALPTFAELARAMWDNPRQVADVTIDYWAAQQALWQKSMLKWLGAKDDAEAIELPHQLKADKRFAHKEWTENALFEYLKENYLLTSGWVQNTVASVGEMDPKERKKAALYTRNYVEALNPANFFALNPEVLETTVNERGENLVRGLKMMLADLERGKGKLLIRQTDMDAFEVGRNIAVTPGQVIWQNDILQLIQYRPSTEQVYEKPLLMVPPWINKYYILDLNEKKSMVKWLLAQGYTVFMVSWVNPDERHKDRTWEDYMVEGASAAIDVALKETGQKSLNLASYCVGGTLTGTLMAHLAKAKDKRVNSVTFFTAQLDFEDAGELQCLVDEQMLEVLQDEKGKGYFPADRMAAAFNMLRANDLIWGYVVSNYLLGKDPFPFDLLFWNSDSTAMPARVHHFYLESFYLENQFPNEGVRVGGETLRIQDIEGPVYHVATKEDHIAPAHSVYRGAKEMRKAEIRFILSGSGHIAGVVNPPAVGKYQFWTNADMDQPTLEDWLNGATETPGSWWPDWDAWLQARSGPKVPAREAGATTGVIEPAPGSYVKVRFDSP